MTDEFGRQLHHRTLAPRTSMARDCASYLRIIASVTRGLGARSPTVYRQGCTLSLINQPAEVQVAPWAADPGSFSPTMTWLESHPVTSIRIDSLVLEGSPRHGGEDDEHIRVLAETGDAVPPIIVHLRTRRVIDGAHRVRAALLNGNSMIRARVVDCTDEMAFVLAVNANVTHGLPLSQPDRTAAAARIVSAHPQWSDRAVAAATGLSDKTVSRIRTRSAGETPQSGARLGRDGRLRPLDSARRRERAAAIILERPDAGLREVARATGLSPATVRDVRRRIDRDEDPVPGRYRPAGNPEPSGSPQTARQRRAPTGGHASRRRDVVVKGHLLLARLRRDPSLRLNEAGRNTLRWLHRYTVDVEELAGVGGGVPDHWAPAVAKLARSCASTWSAFADQLERRIETNCQQ